MKEFSLRIENISVRTCDSHLSNSGKISTAEIVKWIGDTCYTLAFWVKSTDGYDLKFVGNRPFNVNHKLFFKVAKFGQEMLDRNLD